MKENMGRIRRSWQDKTHIQAIAVPSVASRPEDWLFGQWRSHSPKQSGLQKTAPTPDSHPLLMASPSIDLLTEIVTVDLVEDAVHYIPDVLHFIRDCQQVN